MASVASGKTSCTDKEKTLMKLQAEVVLQEEVTRLAAKRLAGDYEHVQQVSAIVFYEEP